MDLSAMRSRQHHKHIGSAKVAQRSAPQVRLPYRHRVEGERQVAPRLREKGGSNSSGQIERGPFFPNNDPAQHDSS